MAAAFKVRFLRGSTAANNAYVGPAGEVTIDTTVWAIRIHDGATPGGRPVVNEDGVQAKIDQALANYTGGVSAAESTDMVPGTTVNDKAVTPMGLEGFLSTQLGISYDATLGDWVNDEGVIA